MSRWGKNEWKKQQQNARPGAGLCPGRAGKAANNRWSKQLAALGGRPPSPAWAGSTPGWAGQVPEASGLPPAWAGQPVRVGWGGARNRRPRPGLGLARPGRLPFFSFSNFLSKN